MIRFVDLQDQILEDYPQFAWFNTVTDTFFELNDCQAWETWLEFEHDFCENENDIYIVDSGTAYPIERFRKLFPDNWEVNARKTNQD